MSDTKTGADWELGEAARKLSIVLGVEGQQAEALTAALSDHAAAVGSKSTQMIAALFTPLLTNIQQARDDIGRVAEKQVAIDLRQAQIDQQQQHNERLFQERSSWFYKKFGDFLKDADARFKGYDDTIATVEEVVRGLGGLEQRIDTLSERMTDVENALAARPEARAAEHRAIVDEIGGKLDTFGHEFAEFKVAFAVFNASLLLSENAVVVINLSQVIIRANRKALEYFGYAAEELIGQPLDILIPERFRAVHRQHIEAFAASHETQQLMADRRMVYGLHRDGTEFPIKAAISKVPDGFTAVVRRVNDGTQ